MKNDKSIQLKIATILRKIGSKKCLAKAEMLEELASPRSLHLRSLDLNSENIISIASCFSQENTNNYNLIKSISFSYNTQMGNLGVTILAKNLPKSITEIGLVGCGISDSGGIELLNSMENMPNLQMICVEENHFSKEVSIKFREFSQNNPQILVVF
ncbi:MAG: hypothetical protein ACJAUH_000800 [Saprospiraceae bacterium]